MKGNNEFAYFLVAGLFIIAILMAIFSAGIKPADKNVTQEPGFIEAVKTFSIPSFSASDVLQTQTANLEARWVQSGLLFGEEKITYNLVESDLEDIRINFRVNSANGLGKLVVKVNNRIVENRAFEPGYYSIIVDSALLSDENNIEIAAESSWWKIWAPNIYKVSDASVAYTTFSDDFSQFRLYLGEEYLNMEFAKIDLVFGENVGAFMVELNGRRVWNSPVANLQSITLDKADLRLGDNVIALKAAQNSRFSGNATIAVIFLAQFPETISQYGTVTALQPLTGFSNQFYG